MRLGRAPVYAIIAVVHIASHQEDHPIPGKEIARSCQIPTAHLMKILQQLVRAGILISGRGPAGGFSLGRATQEISLLDIVEAVEGPISTSFSIEDSLLTSDSARSGVEGCCKEVADYTRSILSQKSINSLLT